MSDKERVLFDARLSPKAREEAVHAVRERQGVVDPDGFEREVRERAADEWRRAVELLIGVTGDPPTAAYGLQVDGDAGRLSEVLERLRDDARGVRVVRRSGGHWHLLVDVRGRGVVELKALTPAGLARLEKGRATVEDLFASRGSRYLRLFKDLPCAKGADDGRL